MIDTLKAAFVQGRLDKNEFDLRVGQAFVSRTYAELAAVTADIPAGLTTAKPPTPARAQGEARIPRPGAVLTVATVLYAGIWAFLVPQGTLGGPGGIGMLTGLATVFYWIVVIFAGAQLAESRQKKRSGGQSSRRPALGVDGQAVQRLPSVAPGRQLPPGHRAHWHTAKAARRRLPRPPLAVSRALRRDGPGGRVTPAEARFQVLSVGWLPLPRYVLALRPNIRQSGS